MSVYFMPLETVMINVVEKVEKREHLYNVGGNINCYSHCGKKLKIKQPCDPAMHYWIYIQRKKITISISRRYLLSFFITVSFMTLKVGKQLNKIWYIEENIIQNIITVEFYSAIKKQEILFVIAWIKMEGIMLNKIN